MKAAMGLLTSTDMALRTLLLAGLDAHGCTINTAAIRGERP